MIYTLTCNPSLDYIVSVNDFKLGKTNRTTKEEMLPGGKGINVSIVLQHLGIKTVALGVIAGFVGTEIEKRLQEMGLQTEFLQANAGCSRINVKLKSVEGTEINGAGPEIEKETLDALWKQMDALTSKDSLVLAGSVSKGMPADLYEQMTAYLQKKGVSVSVDATGDLLLRVLPHHPFLIKPNKDELGELFGCTIKTEEEIMKYAKKLQEMGAENVLVSMAGDGAILVAADRKIYRAKAPKGELVNGVGAGDSMVAGFLAGWEQKKSYEHAFQMGVAAGSASAFSQFLATKEEVETLYKECCIEQQERK